MINKFLKLIRKYHTGSFQSVDSAKDAITLKVDLLIESQDYKYILEALQCGYTPNSLQKRKIFESALSSNNFGAIIGTTISDWKYGKERMEAKAEEFKNGGAEELIIYIARSDPKFVEEYIKLSCSGITIAGRDSFLGGRLDALFKIEAVTCLISNDFLFNCIKQTDTKSQYTVSLDNVKTLYQKRLKETNFLEVIRDNYEATPNIPTDIHLKVKIIKQSIRQIDVAYLSMEARAELKGIVDVSLPEMLKKYSVMDEKMLGYKNENNETLDSLLKENLRQLNEKVSTISVEAAEAAASARMKEIKINTRTMNHAK